MLACQARGGPRAAALAGVAVLVPAAIGITRLVGIDAEGQVRMLFLLVLIAA